MNKIIRNKDNGYSVINNHCLRNKNISEKAKGVFAIIMSLPDNWDFSINGLVSICHGGESAIRSAIKELIENGYCQRNVIKNPTTKRIIDWEYTFSEKPFCDFPQVEEPQVGNPHLENHTQLNKDELIPKINKKRLTKKEQYLLDFDSELISIFQQRPEIEKSILDWIDYKFDVKKKPYSTVRWLLELHEYSDNQIIESIKTAMAKEYQGFFPDNVKAVSKSERKQLRLPKEHENLMGMQLSLLLTKIRLEKGIDYMPDITQEQFDSLPMESKYESFIKSGHCKIIEE